MHDVTRGDQQPEVSWTRAAGCTSHPAATRTLTAERFDLESAPEVAVEGDAIPLRRAARDPALATPREVTRVDTVSCGRHPSDQTIALQLRLVEGGAAPVWCGS